MKKKRSKDFIKRRTLIIQIICTIGLIISTAYLIFHLEGYETLAWVLWGAFCVGLIEVSIREEEKEKNENLNDKPSD